jgi:hypothetical protein
VVRIANHFQPILDLPFETVNALLVIRIITFDENTTFFKFKHLVKIINVVNGNLVDVADDKALANAGFLPLALA